MELRKQIEDLIFAGNKMMAIKQLRDSSGFDLRDAKAQVEQIESELHAEFPDRFGLPGTSSAQKKAESIITKEDFVIALSRSNSGWNLECFKKIPMGWSATLANGSQELEVWSHKSDIEASLAHHTDHASARALLHPFPKTLSDYQQLHHILDAALKNE